MANLIVEKGHALAPDKAKTAAEAFMARAQKDPLLLKFVTLEWKWKTEGKEIELKMEGRVKIKGMFKIEANKVKVELDLPLLARAFSNTIKERVSKNLDETFV